MKKENKLYKNQMLVTGIAVFLTVVAMIGTSYALFTSTSKQEAYNTLQVGTLQISYVDQGTGLGDVLQLADAYPIPDSEGQNSKPYRFDVQNTGTLSAIYTIKIVIDEAITTEDGCLDKQLPLSSVKYQFDHQTPEILGSKENSDFIVYTGTLSAGSSRIHEVRMWIDEHSDNSVLGKHFHGKVVVEGLQDKDPSGAAEPELASNMIPVLYNDKTGNWMKADPKNGWYNYNMKRWANAVVVKETGTKTRAEYQSAEAGTEISMDDILQMLVWIPRYKYAMPSSREGQIDIVFEDRKTPKSTGTATGANYLTHPAFTFGTNELNGLWVGKFESSSDIVCTTSTGAQGTGCDLTTVKPQVKPNVKSWTGARVSTFFTASRNVQATGNPYGYNQSGIDTHMMKNSEWGAVAYLTQSKYGRCIGGVCTEVTINNLNSGDGRTITGCAGNTITASELKQSDCPATNKYNTEKGVLASTTANVYGIYDMAGGNWEYVMGSYNKYSGYTAISYTKEQAATILGRTDGMTVGVWNSGFNGPIYGKGLDGTTTYTWTTGIDFPEAKYYDLYTTADISTSCNGKACLGHALTETAGWYSDYQYPVYEAHPWLSRGSGYNRSTESGVFGFSNYSGYSHMSFTFRLVVTAE